MLSNQTSRYIRKCIRMEVFQHYQGFTQLIESLNDWCNAFHDKIETDIIYLDFLKAFDTAAHQHLLYKLLH